MYKCEECNLEFETFQAKANHVRWNHKDNSEYKKNARKAFFEKVDKYYGTRIEEDIKCAATLCSNIIHVKYRVGKAIPKTFCCKSCANTMKAHTEKSNLKTSQKIKQAWKNGIYDTVEYQLKQSKNNKFSSKQERKIVHYFKNKYPEQEWTCGGGLRYKNQLISRDLYSNKLKICFDLYSNKLKICFEYDGIWHFEDIKGQLKKKQRKDKLLEEWCMNNYRLIRIDENDYIFKQIEELFFQNNNSIVKIGKRY